MDDRKFDELLDEAGTIHNPPPQTPRERMWRRIDAAREGHRGVNRPDFGNGEPARRPVWQMIAAAAAILVIGIGIGRYSGIFSGAEAPTRTPLVAQDTTAPDIIEEAGPAVRDRIYQLAATDLFGRADVLLTDFKVSTCTSQDLSEVPSWAGGMLLQTRLLLDGPVAEDFAMLSLLEELEFVLAQIVGLSRDNCARDVASIQEGLQERSTLDRLRMMADESMNQGAL